MKVWRIEAVALIATLLLASSQPVVANEICTSQRAKGVEEQLDLIESWQSFAVLYRRDGACDTSALSYAFTQAVAKLAAQSNGIEELSLSIKKSPWLRRVVLRHLKSDAVSQDDAARIATNVRDACHPKHKRDLCRAILKALRQQDNRGQNTINDISLPARSPR